MENVILKGTNSGFKVQIDDSCSYRQINEGLKKLMEKVTREQKPKGKAGVSFDIETNNRLLSDKEKKKIRNIVSAYDGYSVRRISGDVITTKEATSEKQRGRIKIIGATIRNGEDVMVKGDVLFLGNLHSGGRLKASGNIYTLANVNGILQAGFPDNEEALIIGNLNTCPQVRIGEQVDIVTDHFKERPTDAKVVFVNDLNNIEYGDLDNLKKISPKFFNKIGGI